MKTADIHDIRYLKVRYDGKNRFSGGKVYYPEPKKLTYDMHYEIEFGMVLKGRMFRYLGNKRNECRAGDVWTCGIWEPHGFATSSTPCEVAVFMLSPDMLAQTSFEEVPEISLLSYYSGNGRTLVPPNKKSLRTALNMIEEVLCLLEDNDGLSVAKKRTFLICVLLHLIGWDSDISKSKYAKNISSDYSKILPAVEQVFIQKSALSVSDAASLCSMGEDQFCRTFSSAMGMSFGKFAKSHRISMVASALSKTEISIKQIAFEFGFTDVSHLSNMFRKVYSLSPAKYRQMKSEPIAELINR
jgi:AraC-like DNA-binding protein/quercetin dioxygenase-like cupin family protein